MKKRPNPAKRRSHNEADTLVYQIDERLYVNLTDRCTLACTFCPKHNGCTNVKGHELYLSERPDVDKIIEEIDDPTQYEEIVFCGYGEPTLRLKALLTIAQAVKSKGGKTRINTDGLANRVHKRDVTPEMATCIDALSISLNAQDESTYNRHCEPSLKNSHAEVLKFIEAATKVIPDVSATAIDGLEGVDIKQCKQLAQARGAKFRARFLDNVG
ncbi:MAG: TatD family nuclease-associated radical SAM protein [Pontibacterium sp.]